MKRVLSFITAFVFVFFSGCASTEGNNSNVMNYIFPSDGTVVEKDGRIEMRTILEDNRFSYVVLQLWTDVPSDHLMNISVATEGKQTGLYMHKLESGYYIISLKANSNLKDESVYMRVLLTKGRSYTYSYNVKELSEKKAVVSDFKFKLN